MSLQGVNPFADQRALRAIEQRHCLQHLVPANGQQWLRIRGEFLLLRRPLLGSRRQCVLVFGFESVALRLLHLCANGGVHRRDDLLQRAGLRLNRIHLFLASLLLGVGREFDFGVLGGSEEGLQPVKVALRNRIELVVVAASTRDGESEHRGTEAAHHLGEQFLANHFAVEVAADHVDRPAAVQAGRGPEVGRVAR